MPGEPAERTDIDAKFSRRFTSTARNGVKLLGLLTEREFQPHAAAIQTEVVAALTKMIADLPAHMAPTAQAIVAKFREEGPIAKQFRRQVTVLLREMDEQSNKNRSPKARNTKRDKEIVRLHDAGRTWKQIPALLKKAEKGWDDVTPGAARAAYRRYREKAPAEGGGHDQAG